MDLQSRSLTSFPGSKIHTKTLEKVLAVLTTAPPTEPSRKHHLQTLAQEAI